jgi:hypothetical protein
MQLSKAAPQLKKRFALLAQPLGRFSAVAN